MISQEYLRLIDYSGVTISLCSLKQVEPNILYFTCVIAEFFPIRLKFRSSLLPLVFALHFATPHVSNCAFLPLSLLSLKDIRTCLETQRNTKQVSSSKFQMLEITHCIFSVLFELFIRTQKKSFCNHHLEPYVTRNDEEHLL